MIHRRQNTFFRGMKKTSLKIKWGGDGGGEEEEKKSVQVLHTYMVIWITIDTFSIWHSMHWRAAVVFDLFDSIKKKSDGERNCLLKNKTTTKKKRNTLQEQIMEHFFYKSHIQILPQKRLIFHIVKFLEFRPVPLINP